MSILPFISGERTVSSAARTSTSRSWLTRYRYVVMGGAVGAVAIITWIIPSQQRDEEFKNTTTAIGALAPWSQPKPAEQPEPAKATEPKAEPKPADTGPIAKDTGPAWSAPRASTNWVNSYQVPQLPDSLKKTIEKATGPTESTQIVYKPSTIVGAEAGTMKNRALVLMPGVYLCTLTTAINSQLAGPFMCTLKDDAKSPRPYSITLMEAGTQIIGNYSSGVSHGQNRIMTLSGTGYTPNGVVVPLGGPMADALGRTGLEGEVDNHFWQRFGGAIMLMIGQGAIQAANTALQQPGTSNFSLNTGEGGSVISEVLRNTINIPPTVTVNQGELVGLWVTTPISFEKSYRLEVRR